MANRNQFQSLINQRPKLCGCEPTRLNRPIREFGSINFPPPALLLCRLLLLPLLPVRMRQLFSHAMHHFRSTMCACATCAARPLDTPFDLLRRPVVSAMSVGSAPFDWLKLQSTLAPSCSCHCRCRCICKSSRCRVCGPVKRTSFSDPRTAGTDGQRAQFSANYRRSLHFGQYVRFDAMWCD